MPRDHIFAVPGGFDCMVHGRSFGTWATREMARAGMEVEQMRAAKRADRLLTQEQWDGILADFCEA